MPGPSIRGAAFQRMVDDVRALVDDDRIGPDELGARLEPADLRFLESDEKLASGFWYPLESADRMLKILLDVQGRGSESFLAEHGYETARRILDSPGYSDFLDSAARWGERAGHALIRLAELVVNVGQWRYVGETMQDFQIEVSDCAAMPDTFRYAAEGFISQLSSRFADMPIRVTSERPTKDKIIYHARGR